MHTEYSTSYCKLNKQISLHRTAETAMKNTNLLALLLCHICCLRFNHGSLVYAMCLAN